ncbi:MAG: hypothetical protein FWD17_12155, partial [Polyangiaceae bacterium]|nr:hypothetical protein [Polyangiaceae bacterium]
MIPSDAARPSGPLAPAGPREGPSTGTGEDTSFAPPPSLTRWTGARASEAWLRARVEEARAAADTTALRAACTALARWLASRERNLDEAIDLATTALSLGVDGELRREVSAWLETLGEPARAAGVLRPLIATVPGQEREAVYLLVRIGTLKTRAMAGGAAAFEAAMSIDPDDPVLAELFAGLSSWEPEAVSPASAAGAYIEASRRHALLGNVDAEIENLWRAVAACPESELATRALAASLELRGRPDAADEVWRGHATAVAGTDPARASATHARRRAAASAAGDPLRALGAALDQEADCTLDPESSEAFDALLRDLGLVDVVAGRLEVRAETAAPRRERTRPGAHESNVCGAAVRAWARLPLADDVRQRAIALERAASALPGPLRAVLLAAAAGRYHAAGERSASRRAAEAAVAADPESARAAVALADCCLSDRDAAAVAALERAVTRVGPRAAFCHALADALDALGDPKGAAAWSRRLLAIRPVDRRALEKLLDRLVRAG